MRFVLVTCLLLGLFISVNSQTSSVPKDAGRVIVAGFGGFDAPVAGSQNPELESSVSPVPFEAVDTKSSKIPGVIVGP